MPSGNGYLLIVFSVLTFIPLFAGLKGIYDFDKVNNISKYYMSVNNLMLGAMMSIVLILHLIYMLHWGWLSSIKKNFFYYMLFWIMSLIVFIAGMHGIINKEKINDEGFYKLSCQKFGTAMIFAIFLVAFWFKVHGHIPDLH